MHSTRSTIVFVFAMTSIVALVLAFLFNGLKGTHERNEAVYNKKAILSAIETELGESIDEMSDDRAEEIFSTKIKQAVVTVTGDEVEESFVADRYKGGKAENIDLKKEKKLADDEKILPVFEYKSDAGKTYYIASVRGSGLWDDIWGYVALEDDLNTVSGIAFGHKGETPGLGAEIKDSAYFKSQFKGKKIYNENGEFVSIYVRKGGAKDPVHEVDGISGATITADGVTEMLDRGLKYYESYFKTLKG